jgi:hypothetical protein
MKLSEIIQQLQAMHAANGDVEVVCIVGGPTLDPLQERLGNCHLKIVTNAGAESPNDVGTPYLLIGHPGV